MDSKEQLLERMHSTKGARFESHHRLSLKHYISGYTVAILSLYVICISVGLLIFSEAMNDNSRNLLTFISVTLSVLIIIISLLVASEKYEVKSEIMHYCAREVLDIYTELKFHDHQGIEISDYRNRYQNIINNYPYNHDEIDRLKYLSNEGRIGRYKKLFIYARYLLSILGMNIVYMTIPPLIVIWWFLMRS